MTQQLETPIAHCRRQVNLPCGSSVGSEENIVAVLDEAIPLQGASHADVVEYAVETPMLYAECFALLSDGRKVGLQDSRKFVGWSGLDRNRSLLFRSDGNHCEIVVEADLRGQKPGCVREVYIEARPERRSSLARKFIGVDGDLITLPALPGTT